MMPIQAAPKSHPKHRRSYSNFVMLDGLEPRCLFSLAGNIGGTFDIANGSKVANHLSEPGYNFGVARKGDTTAPIVSYNFFDTNESAGTRNVTISVPAGFKITHNVTQISGGQAGGEALQVQLDTTAVGTFQGDVVVKALDNNETFRFEIKGVVNNFSYNAADDMGALTAKTTHSGSVDYNQITDAASSSVLTPGIRLYHFTLAGKSNFALDLAQPANQPLGLNANVYQDANNNGVLEVGEETNKVTPVHVDPNSLTASTAGQLAGGSYFIKFATDVPASKFDTGLKRVDYTFTASAKSLESARLTVKATGASAALTDGAPASANTGTAFGAVPVGQAVTREFTVTNTGGASTTLSLTPPTAGSGFSIQQGLPPTLAPGASAKFVLRFAPTSTGDKSATIVINSDDSTSPQFDFAVSGTATGAGTPTGDTTRPTAAINSAPRITARSTKPYRFIIRYRDDVGIDPATLDRKDVTVTGPDNTVYGVKLVASASSKKGKVYDVTYRFSTLDGAWDRSDNGAYTIALRSRQVRDTAGNPAPGGTLGQFTVKIPKTTTSASAAVTPAATPFTTGTKRSINDLLS